MMSFSQVVEMAMHFSVIFASIAAICGVNAWRREYVGKKKYDLAEEALALFYEAKNAVAAIRNPVGWGGEGSTRKADENETEKEKAIRDQAYVTTERYLKHQESINRLLSLRYRFMARFGVEAEKPFTELIAVINTVISYSHDVADMQLRWPKSDRGEDYWKMMHKAETVIYARDYEHDEIAQRVARLVEDVEAICRRVVGRQSRWSQATQYARTLPPRTWKWLRDRLPNKRNS